MEDLLHLYSLPYDEKRPIACFDELPVQLLGEVVTPLAMKAGQPTRFDYEYERQGTCSLLVAVEPLTGRRAVETSKQRTKADYCRFMQRVAEMYPQAEKIVLAQDNLNRAQREFFLRELAACRSLCVGATLRDALHAATRLMVEHGGVGIVSLVAHLFIAAHQFNRRT